MSCTTDESSGKISMTIFDETYVFICSDIHSWTQVGHVTAVLKRNESLEIPKNSNIKIPTIKEIYGKIKDTNFIPFMIATATSGYVVPYSISTVFKSEMEQFKNINKADDELLITCDLIDRPAYYPIYDSLISLPDHRSTVNYDEHVFYWHYRTEQVMTQPIIQAYINLDKVDDDEWEGFANTDLARIYFEFVRGVEVLSQLTFIGISEQDNLPPDINQIMDKYIQWNCIYRVGFSLDAMTIHMYQYVEKAFGCKVRYDLDNPYCYYIEYMMGCDEIAYSHFVRVFLGTLFPGYIQIHSGTPEVTFIHGMPYRVFNLLEPTGEQVNCFAIDFKAHTKVKNKVWLIDVTPKSSEVNTSNILIVDDNPNSACSMIFLAFAQFSTQPVDDLRFLALRTESLTERLDGRKDISLDYPYAIGILQLDFDACLSDIVLLSFGYIPASDLPFLPEGLIKTVNKTLHIPASNEWLLVGIGSTPVSRRYLVCVKYFPEPDKNKMIKTGEEDKDEV